MKWQKVNWGYMAVGKDGKFEIVKDKQYYYASYVSQTKIFNFPRLRTVREAKRLCEENYYWENEKAAQVAQNAPQQIIQHSYIPTRKKTVNIWWDN